jgi:hypothetical protein
MAECVGDQCACNVEVEGDYCNEACAAATGDEKNCPCGHEACKT